MLSFADKVLLLYGGKPPGYMPTEEEVQRVNGLVAHLTQTDFETCSDESSESGRFSPNGDIEVIDVDELDDDFATPFIPPRATATVTPTEQILMCASTNKKHIAALQKKHSNLVVVDLSDKAGLYYGLQPNATPSIDKIPIVNSNRLSVTIQGIWECFKLFRNNRNIDLVMLQKQEKIRRKEPLKELIGWQLGESNTSLIPPKVAHDLFFVLPYLWMVEKTNPLCLKFIRDYLKDGKKVLLIDKNPNFSFDEAAYPISVAPLVKLVLDCKARAKIEKIKALYSSVDLSMYSL